MAATTRVQRTIGKLVELSDLSQVCTYARAEEGNVKKIRPEEKAVIPEPVVRRESPPGFFDGLRADAHLFADLEVPDPLPPGGTDVDLDTE